MEGGRNVPENLINGGLDKCNGRKIFVIIISCR